MQRQKILVTSANGKLPLLTAIRDQLVSKYEEATVVAGDANPQCLASRLWPDFMDLPRLDEVSVESFIGMIVESGITHVIPTRDGDVEWFAVHKDLLRAAGVSCLVPASDSVAACRDKLLFAQQLEKEGIRVVETTEEPSCSRSMVVKERYGSGSVGMALNVNQREAESAARLLKAPIFQPFIPGLEISIDVYRAPTGEIRGIVARSRDLVVHGESKITTTTDPEPYSHLANQVLTTLQITGHALIQVIDSAEGPVVLECNPRLGGASTLAMAAGLRTILWFIRESAGEPVDDLPFQQAQWPLRLIRFPQDVIDDPRL